MLVYNRTCRFSDYLYFVGLPVCIVFLPLHIVVLTLPQVTAGDPLTYRKWLITWATLTTRSRPMLQRTYNISVSLTKISRSRPGKSNQKKKKVKVRCYCWTGHSFVDWFNIHIFLRKRLHLIMLLMDIRELRPPEGVSAISIQKYCSKCLTTSIQLFWVCVIMIWG